LPVWQGTVLHVNVSNGGLPKFPIWRGEVTPLGITSDRHAHPNIHGGPDKALLLITAEGVDELREAGHPVFYGALGENVTTRGLDRRSVRIGQRYHIGDVIAQITKVRAPCESLNVYGDGIQKAVYDAEVKAGNPASPRWGLSGFYASVVRGGTIRPGDAVVLLDESA
jgi:MOSC domain-containing protein YiiM